MFLKLRISIALALSAFSASQVCAEGADSSLGWFGKAPETVTTRYVISCDDTIYDLAWAAGRGGHVSNFEFTRNGESAPIELVEALKRHFGQFETVNYAHFKCGDLLTGKAGIAVDVDYSDQLSITLVGAGREAGGESDACKKKRGYYMSDLSAELIVTPDSVVKAGAPTGDSCIIVGKGDSVMFLFPDRSEKKK